MRKLLLLAWIIGELIMFAGGGNAEAMNTFETNGDTVMTEIVEYNFR